MVGLLRAGVSPRVQLLLSSASTVWHLAQAQTTGDGHKVSGTLVFQLASVREIPPKTSQRIQTCTLPGQPSDELRRQWWHSKGRNSPSAELSIKTPFQEGSLGVMPKLCSAPFRVAHN
uniref:Putative secreted protein n=1 Tax=Amblyomma americanum TaxID=6943 RepID=A0A0C9S402_AMBAM